MQECVLTWAGIVFVSFNPDNVEQRRPPVHVFIMHQRNYMCDLIIYCMTENKSELGNSFVDFHLHAFKTFIQVLFRQVFLLGNYLGSVFRPLFWTNKTKLHLKEWEESNYFAFNGHCDIKNACIESLVTSNTILWKSFVNLSKNKHGFCFSNTCARVHNTNMFWFNTECLDGTQSAHPTQALERIQV